MDIFDIVNSTTCLDKNISKAAFNYLHNTFINRQAREICRYVNNHKENLHQNINIAIFDRLIYSYVWEFGKLEYEKRSNCNIMIKICWDKICGKHSFYDAMIYREAEHYAKIVPALQKVVLIILGALDNFHLIDENELKILSNKFILDTHVKYEQILAPKGHIFFGSDLFTIIKKKPKELTRYFKEQYVDHVLLQASFKGDYCDCFYKSTSIPSNDTSIYEILKKLQ